MIWFGLFVVGCAAALLIVVWRLGNRDEKDTYYDQDAGDSIKLAPKEDKKK